jgi:hypothetical protein
MARENSIARRPASRAYIILTLGTVLGVVLVLLAGLFFPPPLLPKQLGDVYSYLARTVGLTFALAVLATTTTMTRLRSPQRLVPALCLAINVIILLVATAALVDGIWL